MCIYNKDYEKFNFLDVKKKLSFRINKYACNFLQMNLFICHFDKVKLIKQNFNILSPNYWPLNCGPIL